MSFKNWFKDEKNINYMIQSLCTVYNKISDFKRTCVSNEKKSLKKDKLGSQAGGM